MKFQVVNVRRQQGVGAKSGKSYNFLVVGGLIDTAHGKEFAEIMLDGDSAPPEVSKVYEFQFSFYPDREKRLAFRVEGLAPVAK